MKDLWINKWTPKCISDIVGNNQAIKSIDNWLYNFDSSKTNNLIISGNHGIGKSLAIKLILEKYNFYTKIIYPDDIKNYRLNNDFSDFYNFDISIKHQMKFTNNNYKKIAIIFDDTECISLSSERKFIMGIHKDNSKKKLFPLIFISNNNHSKLLNDLKKNCLEVKFYSPSSFDVIKLVKKICKQEKLIVKEPDSVMKIIEFSQNDIRRLINILQEYSYCFKEITNKNIDDFINNSLKKNIDIGLYESVIQLINNYNDYDDIFQLYESEKVLLPLMIHENYFKKTFSKENKIDFNEQLEQAINISDSLSKGDNIETSIYTDQNWYLQNIHGFYTCLDTSFWINYSDEKIPFSKIKFSADLNKTSLKNINRKNISNLTKIVSKKSIYEILMLCKLTNKLLDKKQSIVIINILKEYKKDIDIKDIELCLKIDKTIDFMVLSTKEKKEINNLI
jgi:DNA polymerase III delta prime subunit